jgi:hypothetical protein
MSKDTLKIWRLLVPGILMFFAFYPLYQGFAPEIYTSVKTDDALFVIAVVVLGVLYRIFNFRSFFFYQSLHGVHTNIKQRLLNPFRGDPALEQLRSVPAAEFMDVFYQLVDRDPTLTEKAKDVYENGLLLSSFADLATVSAVALGVYLCAYVYTGEQNYANFAVVLIGLLALGIAFVIGLASRHVSLSNAQLRIIERYHGEKARVLLTALVHHHRQTSD